MKAWLVRLFSTAPQSEAQPPGATPAPAAASALAAQPPSLARPADVQQAPADVGNLILTTPPDALAPLELTLLAWLIEHPTVLHAPGGAREWRALQRLDRLSADTGAHAQLLPRAAAVVPQLLARLRDAASSAGQLAQYVSRDVTLVAEVMRVANSSHYRRDAPVVELGHAIRLLGVAGLKSAIARSVLRPMFDARSGELAARSAKRLWQHTEYKAQACAELARGEGLDPFEGYLSGLVHNAVWSAVLRTMDGIEATGPWCVNAAFAGALGLRRDHLFAAVARQWQLSESLAQLAAEVAQRGVAAAASPQAKLLGLADRFATLLCVPDQIDSAEPWLGGLREPARRCFAKLREAQSQAQTAPA